MKVRERKKILKLRQRKLHKVSLQLGFLIRPLIVILTSIIIAAIFHIGREISSLTEGDIALRDVYAPFDFRYKVGIDENKTKELKEKAGNQAGEIFHLNQNASDKILEQLKEFFSLLASIDVNKSSSFPEDLLKFMPQNISFEKLVALKKYNFQEILSQVSLILKEFYKNNYVIKDSRLETLISSGARYVYIKRDKGLTQLTPDNSHLVTLSKARDMISRELKKRFRMREREILLEVISSNLIPNIVFLPQETEELRKEAEEKVKNVYIYREVKKHEKILTQGERIKKEDLMKLREINQRYGNKKFPKTSGVFFFSLLFLSLITLSYKYSNPKFYKDISRLILVSLIIIIVTALTKVIVISPLPSYLTPVAMGALLIAVLISFPIAIKVGIFIAAICSIIIGDNIVPAICFLIGGIMGAMAAKDVRKRSQLLKAGLLIGSSQFFIIVFTGFIFGIDLDVLLKEGTNSFAGGIFSAFFALGLLPILEHTFKVTTNISLLELSDLNHPLLKELLIKAPGTYHHSLIVSSLAEQAAEAIGANPLLARVGAYFHDIGKLEKPEYFSENQSQEKKERSKHDKLSPSMSSLIIINHVKKGLELAQKYKLPPAIIDFIEQHHGRSLVYYFYHKALEIKPEEEIKEEQFRYPGPKPQTKEVAILSLADAVEAATRSLLEPTPARIKGLVKEIINNKFVTGELDECELTLKDLNKIAEVFTRLSVSIHHVRVEYPGEKKQT